MKNFIINLKDIRPVLLLLILGVLYSCEKDSEILQDPYAGGMEPFGINLLNEPPSPASGPPGTEVVFQARGLKKWEGEFNFYINDELSEVLSVTDSTIAVRVPQLVSSGPASVIMDQQVFFGPRFAVEGNVRVDPNFGLSIGTDGPVYDYVEHNGAYLIVGNFTDIEQMDDWYWYFNSMALISEQGVVNEVFNSEMEGEGIGNLLSNRILSTDEFSDGRLLISGSFHSYNGLNGTNGLAVLNGDGSLESHEVDILNLTPDIPENSQREVPVLNGGFPGQTVVKAFVSPNDEIIAVGNLNSYAKINYSQSTYRSFWYDYTRVNNITKLDSLGNLDPSYHSSGQGANGDIIDAVMQEDGKIILAGEFTMFDGQAANRIVRLNENGQVDQSFQVGEGANGRINSIEYNPVVGKIAITGNFSEFNDKQTNGIAVLNSDGSFDENFELRPIEGGLITFADILNDEKVVVSGTFQRYNGITREGFLILAPDGAVDQNFNVAGSFEGEISDVIETTSALGNKALILLGFISRFDDQPTGNIVKIEIQE